MKRDETLAAAAAFLLAPLVLAAAAFLLAPLVLAAEAGLSATSQSLTPRPMCASQYALANYACAMIPYSPLPPPSAATPALESHHGRRRHDGPGDGDSDSDSENEEHRRHHHHRQHHHHKGSQEEEDCCRWLYEIDTDCVCEVLVRLPDFLSRPVHEYTVYVGDSCNVTYTCGGRVIRK